jgi:hypothetical protein
MLQLQNCHFDYFPPRKFNKASRVSSPASPGLCCVEMSDRCFGYWPKNLPQSVIFGLKQYSAILQSQ